MLWELCGGIFAERNVSEKSFHIICRQIALTRQELEEKLQSSGYIPEHLEQLNQTLNRVARALEAARELPPTGKKKPQKHNGNIRKMIYLLVAVFSLLAFLILPRTREDSETWDQQREELAETMDAADKLIEDTKSAERDLQLAKEELQKEMKKNFGVDVVFFGKKDKPYGYMLIDHANKTVIHGARVLAVEELLDFATPEQRFDRIEAFIDQLLTLNPKTTQGEIFQKLKKQRAYIKKGVIYFDGKSRPLPPFMAKAIDRNNRISFIEKFKPTSAAEVALLCKVFKVDRPDLVDISPERSSNYADAVNKLHGIFNDPEVKSPRSTMYQEGFIIRQVDDTYYAINFKEHILINLNEEGFDVERVKKKSKKQKRKGTPLRNLPN